MGCGRAYAGPSCLKLEVVLLGWECGRGSWLGLGSLWRLALSLALLASVPDRTASARVSSSLSTTHHVHHFHNKHGTIPININRMPFLTRGGHDRMGSGLVLFALTAVSEEGWVCWIKVWARCASFHVLPRHCSLSGIFFDTCVNQRLCAALTTCLC
ncbi:hypothetical protein PO909_008227 [Leuciscus waleckii]